MLTLLVVLLLFLGGLLDGLYLGSTGTLRAQRADVIVYSADANDSIIRSRIDPATRARVAGAGVTDVNGLGITLIGTTCPGRSTLADTAVIGYERVARGVPAPPPAGEAWADRRLAAFGVHVGQTLGVGPEQVPIRVRGWVRDTNYLLQGALWVDPSTWRRVQDTSRPDASVPPGTFVVLAVSGRPPARKLATTSTPLRTARPRRSTKSQAVLSSPGTREQKSTFAGIIDVTFLVVGLVVALFFVLLDDRTRLALRRLEGARRIDAASRRGDHTGPRGRHRRVRGGRARHPRARRDSSRPRSPCSFEPSRRGVHRRRSRCRRGARRHRFTTPRSHVPIR